MIKIDMEMPDKCDECLFCTCPWDDFECVATGRGDIIDDVEGEKPYWCPLIEVKECKYTLWNDDSNTYECSECGLAWMLMEGTPMENQMEFCPQCGRKIEVKE